MPRRPRTGPTLGVDAARRRRCQGLTAANVGAEYTPEQLDWLKAVQRLKRVHPHPTWPEVLAMALECGYRRVC